MHCKNEDNGCRANVTLENYSSHEENCTPGVVICPVANCGREIPILEETVHKLEHANETIAQVTCFFDIEKTKDFYFFFLFYFVVEANS